MWERSGRPLSLPLTTDSDGKMGGRRKGEETEMASPSSLFARSPGVGVEGGRRHDVVCLRGGGKEGGKKERGL